MIERSRFQKIHGCFVMLFLCFSLSSNTLVLGDEVFRIKFMHSPVKIQVDGGLYELGYVREGDEKYLVAMDLKGKIVEDSKVLEKIFFVEYVYRPVFDKPKEFLGPVDIDGYGKLDEYRLMQQLADVTLFIRETGVRALVQAGKIYITGGSSAGTAVGEKIAEKTAEHLMESILTNPATYLKGTVSLVFEDAVSNWKRASALFSKTKGNNLLRYEDAKRIHENLSYGRAYGIESTMFLARLTLKEGGGGDLLSQLQKIGQEYAWDEFVSEVKGLYRQKSLVTASMLGYKLETFLLSKVPIYKEYVENTRTFYKELNDFYPNHYLPERIERNLMIAKSKNKDHPHGTVAVQTPSVFTTNFYPAKHSFRFDNNWKGYGPLEELGLCAGMVLTALDLFHTGCNASYFDRPESTSALYHHILSRQVPISLTSIPQDLIRERLMHAMGTLLGPGDRAQNNSIYRKIRETLLSGPVPIGLIGETSQIVNSHVVLGYQLSELSGSLQRKATISVYDPNRGTASDSTLDILWNSKTDRMERISLTASNVHWAELRVIAYGPRVLEKSCAILELENTVSRYWRSVKEKNWQDMFRIVGTAENTSPQRRQEIENAMIQMLKRQWSQTNLKDWQVLDTESIGEGRYKIECLMHIGLIGKDFNFAFHLDLYFHREGDSWKIYKIDYKKMPK